MLTPLPLPPFAPVHEAGEDDTGGRGGTGSVGRRSRPHPTSTNKKKKKKNETVVGPDFLYQGGLNDAFRLLKCHYIHMGFLDFCDCSRFMKVLCKAAVTSDNNSDMLQDGNTK